MGINVADPVIYMISGLLPLEAEIHTKVFTMFGNITRAHTNSIEWKLAERQLHIKSLDSNSWFMDNGVCMRSCNIAEHCKNLGMYLCFQR
jgi:hypothetical protein